jgi:hypothetical protein
VINLAGPAFKASLAKTAEPQIDFTPKVQSAYASVSTPSVDTPLVDDDVGVTVSLLDQLSKVDVAVWAGIGLLLVVIVIAGVVYFKRKKTTL